jgi:hypothetical protein
VKEHYDFSGAEHNPYLPPDDRELDRNRYFGPCPWGPAFHEPELMIAAPIGLPCADCAEPIAKGDDGITQMQIDYDVERVRTVLCVARHRECFLRAIVGSVGHQTGQCSCFGGTEEDPPGLTRRQKAQAALALFDLKLGTIARRYVPTDPKSNWITSALVESHGAHEVLRVWVRGKLTGELTASPGEGIYLALRLGLVPT